MKILLVAFFAAFSVHSSAAELVEQCGVLGFTLTSQTDASEPDDTGFKIAVDCDGSGQIEESELGKIINVTKSSIYYSKTTKAQGGSDLFLAKVFADGARNVRQSGQRQAFGSQYVCLRGDVEANVCAAKGALIVDSVDLKDRYANGKLVDNRGFAMRLENFKPKQR